MWTGMESGEVGRPWGGWYRRRDRQVLESGQGLGNEWKAEPAQQTLEEKADRAWGWDGARFNCSWNEGFHGVLPCPHLLPISPREVFEPTVERGELVVRYRVRKSYSRRTTEATCK